MLRMRRCVLRVRCEHFRARCDSGMRDAFDCDLPVPEHFSKVHSIPCTCSLPGSQSTTKHLFSNEVQGSCPWATPTMAGSALS